MCHYFVCQQNWKSEIQEISYFRCLSPFCGSDTMTFAKAGGKKLDYVLEIFFSFLCCWKLMTAWFLIRTLWVYGSVCSTKEWKCCSTVSSDAKNLWNTVVKMFCFVFSSTLRVVDVLGTFITVRHRGECGLEAWNGETTHVLCASY